MPGLALLALLPSTGRAQQGRNFRDAWFWGAKAGNMTYWTRMERHAQAPLIGGEWLITRSRGGLYLSLDQAVFTGKTLLPGYTDAAYQIDFKDMRRFTAAGFFFPGQVLHFRPYGGIGFALNFIQQAKWADPSIDADISAYQNRASPIIIAGGQFQLMRFSVFGQGSYMPAQDRFLLNNNETYFVEAGIRWNIGSSIDRPGR